MFQLFCCLIGFHGKKVFVDSQKVRIPHSELAKIAVPSIGFENTSHIRYIEQCSCCKKTLVSQMKINKS